MVAPHFGPAWYVSNERTARQLDLGTGHFGAFQTQQEKRTTSNLPLTVLHPTLTTTRWQRQDRVHLSTEHCLLPHLQYESVSASHATVRSPLKCCILFATHFPYFTTSPDHIIANKWCTKYPSSIFCGEPPDRDNGPTTSLEGNQICRNLPPSLTVPSVLGYYETMMCHKIRSGQFIYIKNE